MPQLNAANDPGYQEYLQEMQRQSGMGGQEQSSGGGLGTTLATGAVGLGGIGSGVYGLEQYGKMNNLGEGVDRLTEFKDRFKRLAKKDLTKTPSKAVFHDVADTTDLLKRPASLRTESIFSKFNPAWSGVSKQEEKLYKQLGKMHEGLSMHQVATTVPQTAQDWEDARKAKDALKKKTPGAVPLTPAQEAAAKGYKTFQNDPGSLISRVKKAGLKNYAALDTNNYKTHGIPSKGEVKKVNKHIKGLTSLQEAAKGNAIKGGAGAAASIALMLLMNSMRNQQG